MKRHVKNGQTTYSASGFMDTGEYCRYVGSYNRRYGSKSSLEKIKWKLRSLRLVQKRRWSMASIINITCGNAKFSFKNIKL